MSRTDPFDIAELLASRGAHVIVSSRKAMPTFRRMPDPGRAGECPAAGYEVIINPESNREGTPMTLSTRMRRRDRAGSFPASGN